LIEVSSASDEPAVQIDIDPTTLDDDYEIGFGFYYKFLFRLPERIELDLPRNEWLGIAGMTETGDYAADDQAGDRALSVFSKPWNSDGM